MSTKEDKLWVYKEALAETLFIGDGRFAWHKKKLGRKVGSIVGTKNSLGYIVFNFTASDNKRYYLRNSYMNWVYHNGCMPVNIIDHIDRVKHNDNIENLRDISHRDNLLNSGPRLGRFKGVHYLGNCGKWRAGFKSNGSYITIGYYDTEVDAAKAFNETVSSLSPYHYLNDL